MPEIVRAAAESFEGIDHLVVLNGAEGMNGMLSQVMGAGVAGIETRVAAIGEGAAELEQAQARLQRSLGEAQVLAGALGEARALVARATGLIPR
jgi:hypothetical protein